MGERHQEHKQECEMMEGGIQAKKEDKSSGGGVAVNWKNKLDGNDKDKRLWVIEGLSGFKIVCMCVGIGMGWGWHLEEKTGRIRFLVSSIFQNKTSSTTDYAIEYW